MNQASSESAESLSFGQQFSSLNTTYWVANTMEMFERLAYYGLRTVVPVYMLLAVEEGGPQFDNIQKGTIFAWWAMVQSFVPIVSGGYADRFGYKLTVGLSIAVKVLGYLVMAFAIDLAVAMTAGAAAGVPGHPATYGWFLFGALLLALGTAIFKPGVQGIIATQITERNGSLAWALFYQLVNLGGFLGPFLAGAMRVLAWKWVFVSCAVIVCVNYLLLLTFPEPDKKGEGPEGSVYKVLEDSVAGILEPRLLSFLAVFSGFWAMFYQLFDLLPNFIDHWVDSSSVYQVVMVPIFSLFGASPPAEFGGMVPQEWMINLNAGMIMLFAFAVGYLTGFMRSMTAMILGIVVSAVGIWMLGTTMNGWWILFAIAIFSAGEMMASPTKMRYFASIAPDGKKGLYLGYINATVGIGWALGSFIAGSMYEEGGDREVLASRHLVDELGMEASAVEALPKSDILPTLAERLGTDLVGARELLWNTYHPYEIWQYFTMIGVISMLGLLAFDQITQRFEEGDTTEAWSLVGLTGLVTGICYGPAIGAGFAVVMAARALAGSLTAARLLLVVGTAYVLGSLAGVV